MIIDVLVADIGSTTTKVMAFDGIGGGQPKYIGQGFALTSIRQGDVTIGLHEAIEYLRNRLGVDRIEARETYACSSAAGGLKMSVHGLVYDMTVRAAKEAALGAGANLKMITAGLLLAEDLERIQAAGLNIIMIAGGVDHGERATAIANATAIARLRLDVPVIYAGNVDGHDAVRAAFKESGQEAFLTISTNVYPQLDVLAVEAARMVIQNVFETHIIKAPGMEKIRSLVNGIIIPTPGAVMNAAILLREKIGDLVVADVGGATTDIHSVTEGDEMTAKRALAPEPVAKRTVEGDLGVYVNRQNLVMITGTATLAKNLGITEPALSALLDQYQPLPSPAQIPVVEQLTRIALETALGRHAGALVSVFGTTGMTTCAVGRDLSSVRHVIGTGGALTRLPHGIEMLAGMILTADKKRLYPPPTVAFSVDSDYIMAACGAIASKYPKAALCLLGASLGIEVSSCIRD
ncbi:MAG: glutamate mutase L [bacterium]